jgi:protein-disulfide isomerase
MGKRQQSEAPSKRQARKEELKKKERRQRTIMLSAIGLGVLALLALIFIPSMLKSSNPAGEFVKVTPGVYKNADGTYLGDSSSKVKVDVFSDFQCSACKVYEAEVEPEVISQIVDQSLATYEYHQFPFLDDSSTDKSSDRAALASECASEQGRFWDYKKILFVNQTGIAGQFSDVRLQAFADSLELDMEQFNACLETAKYQSKIEADLALGSEKGVDGTPSVFVNGVNVSPGQIPTFAQILQLVQQGQ